VSDARSACSSPRARVTRLLPRRPQEDDDGNPFWYNNTTGVSQYENPYEEGSVAAAAGAEGAGDEWQQAEDENGIPYWCVSPTAGIAPYRTRRVMCVDRGFLPRYNPMTGVSQYENPHEAGAEAAYYEAEGGAGGWMTAEDENGVPYWYDQESGLHRTRSEHFRCISRSAALLAPLF
jgi:hypothetical protein